MHLRKLLPPNCKAHSRKSLDLPVSSLSSPVLAVSLRRGADRICSRSLLLKKCHQPLQDPFDKLSFFEASCQIGKTHSTVQAENDAANGSVGFSSQTNWEPVLEYFPEAAKQVVFHGRPLLSQDVGMKLDSEPFGGHHLHADLCPPATFEGIPQIRATCPKSSSAFRQKTKGQSLNQPFARLEGDQKQTWFREHLRIAGWHKATKT